MEKVCKIQEHYKAVALGEASLKLGSNSDTEMMVIRL